MKTNTILDAITALRAADARLRDVNGPGYVAGDIRLATACFSAASALDAQLPKTVEVQP